MILRETQRHHEVPSFLPFPCQRWKGLLLEARSFNRASINLTVSNRSRRNGSLFRFSCCHHRRFLVINVRMIGIWHENYFWERFCVEIFSRERIRRDDANTNDIMERFRLVFQQCDIRFMGVVRFNEARPPAVLLRYFSLGGIIFNAMNGSSYLLLQLLLSPCIHSIVQPGP